MAIPKIIWESKKEDPSQDKKKVEALIERLNRKIQSDPDSARKAALIIEQWLRQKPKR